MNKKNFGNIGEVIACKFLSKNNYKVIEKNFYYRGGEIDIIAHDLISREIVFIEVKTRANLKYGKPVEAVSHEKVNKIIRGARYYLHIHGLDCKDIRFDIMELYYSKQKFYINHIKQII